MVKARSGRTCGSGLFIDPEELKKDYAASPEWLRKLMNAWASGINFYLTKHPEVKRRC